MPSQKAVRADDKRLATPGVKRKKRRPGTSNTINVPNPNNDRQAAYLSGKLTIRDMTDKELEKGRWVNNDGKFTKGPANYPAKFFEELRQELMRRWNNKLVEELGPSVQALREIRDNPRAPADARHKSAVYLIDRVVGKTPEKNEVKVELSKWEADIEGLLVDSGEEASE